MNLASESGAGSGPALCHTRLWTSEGFPSSPAAAVPIPGARPFPDIYRAGVPWQRRRTACTALSPCRPPPPQMLLSGTVLRTGERHRKPGDLGANPLPARRKRGAERSRVSAQELAVTPHVCILQRPATLAPERDTGEGGEERREHSHGLSWEGREEARKAGSLWIWTWT